MKQRLILILLLLPLWADCLANWILGGSIRNTLSGEAWHQRTDHGYCHFINGLFRDPDHCKDAAANEAKYGSMWANWRHNFKQAQPGELNDPEIQ